MKIILVSLIITLSLYLAIFFSGQGIANQSDIQTKKEKVPQFISIESEREEQKQTIYDFIFQNLQSIQEKFQDQSQEQIDDDINNIQEVFKTDQKQGKWKYPQSWHTTILFLGGKIEKTNDPLYTEFQEGKQVQLQSSTFVYLPGKIMCSIVFPEDQEIDNNVPHMTIMQGAWRPVQCNDVLESVFFNKDAPYKQEYKQLESGEQLDILDYSSIHIYGKQEKAYIVSGIQEFDILGENKAMF